MPFSTLRKIRLRALDRLRALAEPPGRVDVQATVANSAWVRASAIHGPVEIGEHATVYRAELSGPVRVGRNTSLWGPEIYVHARRDPVEIGSFCSIARHVGIHGYLHDAGRITTYYVGRNVLGRPVEDEIVTRGPTRIGHDVWIGAGAQVMAGVSVGTGAVVGAGSIVTRDVEPYAVAVGSPARVVRRRFDPEVVERLLASRWWEWSHDEIRRRAELFSEPVTPELLDRWL